MGERWLNNNETLDVSDKILKIARQEIPLAIITGCHPTELTCLPICRTSSVPILPQGKPTTPHTLVGFRRGECNDRNHRNLLAAYEVWPIDWWNLSGVSVRSPASCRSWTMSTGWKITQIKSFSDCLKKINEIQAKLIKITINNFNNRYGVNTNFILTSKIISWGKDHEANLLVLVKKKFSWILLDL